MYIISQETDDHASRCNAVELPAEFMAASCCAAVGSVIILPSRWKVIVESFGPNISFENKLLLCICKPLLFL